MTRTSRNHWNLLGIASLLVATPLACSAEDDSPDNDTSCQSGAMLCSGQCVDVMANAWSCGACDVVCEAGRSCAMGQCACADGRIECSGVCTDLQSDGLNCGTCSNACPTGMVCSLGACATSCMAGLTTCGQSCIDVSSDTLNCGACGAACATGQDCVDGLCTCPMGQLSCGGICTDVASDATNCGQCGVICPSGSSCVAGACTSTGTGGASTGTGGTSTGGSTTGTGGSTTGNDTEISEGEFSFFVISYDYIVGKCGSSGCGGDLGGLSGADAMCAEAAAIVTGSADNHAWRAFLSTSTVDAKDRIGTGPWYSAVEVNTGVSHLVANDLSGLVNQLRPDGSTAVLFTEARSFGDGWTWVFNQCLTNEYGRCPRQESNGQEYDDNHDILTGTNRDGTYAGSLDATCQDWTSSSTNDGPPAIGHIWPRQPDSTNTAAEWLRTGNDAPSCGKAINVTDAHAAGNGVGSEGGYGAFYCFAVSE